jgi:hypothetical protein
MVPASKARGMLTIDTPQSMILADEEKLLHDQNGHKKCHDKIEIFI